MRLLHRLLSVEKLWPGLEFENLLKYLPVAFLEIGVRNGEQDRIER